jgi:hypothetical protein
MRLIVPVLALALAACGTDPIDPSELHASYGLTTIDGELLPAADGNVPAGAVIVNSWIKFGRDGRPRGGGPLLASYYRAVRLTDGTIQASTEEFLYTLADGQIRIDLCQPGGACPVPSVLIGPAGQNGMVLTHHVGGQPGSVYRFDPVRAE